MIVVENLCKEFGNTRAVRDVSFRVEPGEVIGLLGPNGSGKTTIMRILSGFFPPTAGRAFVAGVEVTRDSLAAREKVGYLPENVVLYPDMRVGEFLEFCADVRRMRGAHRRARIEWAVENCGLVEVRGRLIGKLSKGYRQRVGLAQALLHEPEVLILDEPTVGLDPKQIIEIRTLIRDLRQRTTVMLSTHILPEVSTVCERVIILHHGRIIAQDTAEALTRRIEGNERTLVRVEGPAEAVRAAIEAVPGVLRVDSEPDGHRDTVTFVAVNALDRPVHKAIAAAVVNGGWGLVELRPLAMTLEDLFVRLVSREEVGG